MFCFALCDGSRASPIEDKCDISECKYIQKSAILFKMHSFFNVYYVCNTEIPFMVPTLIYPSMEIGARIP